MSEINQEVKVENVEEINTENTEVIEEVTEEIEETVEENIDAENNGENEEEIVEEEVEEETEEETELKIEDYKFNYKWEEVETEDNKINENVKKRFSENLDEFKKYCKENKISADVAEKVFNFDWELAKKDGIRVQEISEQTKSTTLEEIKKKYPKTWESKFVNLEKYIQNEFKGDEGLIQDILYTSQRNFKLFEYFTNVEKQKNNINVSTQVSKPAPKETLESLEKQKEEILKRGIIYYTRNPEYKSEREKYETIIGKILKMKQQ